MRKQPTQGDLLKELGIARVRAAESDGWKMLFRIHAAQFFRHLKTSETFTGGTLRSYCESAGLGQPHHPNAWSAMIRSVLADELRAERITRYGTEKSDRPAAHSRECPVYIRLPGKGL